jgi:receptor protein-tyrosine kinase
VNPSLELDKLIPASEGNTASHGNVRSIGTILIHAGRLTFEDAERILQLQRDKGMRFGDAATELGLLTQDDIEFALARQFDYPYLVRGESNISEQVVAAYAPFSPKALAISALRGQLMLRWFDETVSGKALAIISAERGEGRSFVVANLAVSFAQLGQRTLLIDADMRNPSQHALFGLENRSGLSAILSGRSKHPAELRRIAGLTDLSVLTAGVQPPNPLELLARPPLPQFLRELVEEFDVVLLDTPCASESADAQTVAVRAGAAIVVVRKNASRLWEVRGMSETVTHASTNVLGSVLNDF